MTVVTPPADRRALPVTIAAVVAAVAAVFVRFSFKWIFLPGYTGTLDAFLLPFLVGLPALALFVVAGLVLAWRGAHRPWLGALTAAALFAVSFLAYDTAQSVQDLVASLIGRDVAGFVVNAVPVTGAILAGLAATAQTARVTRRSLTYGLLAWAAGLIGVMTALPIVALALIAALPLAPMLGIERSR